MPSAELIGLQAPKKAHRSLVFALAAACRQIESAGLIGAASHSSFGEASSREPSSIFRRRRAPPSNIQNAHLTFMRVRLFKSLATDDSPDYNAAEDQRLDGGA